MSLARKRYGQAVNRRGIVEALPPEFRESFPALSEFLGGSPAAEGLSEVFPHTVMIFAEAGRLKYCLNCSQSSAVGFGCIQDPAKPMESLELEIAQDKIDWRPRKGSR